MAFGFDASSAVWILESFTLTRRLQAFKEQVVVPKQGIEILFHGVLPCVVPTDIASHTSHLERKGDPASAATLLRDRWLHGSPNREPRAIDAFNGGAIMQKRRAPKLLEPTDIARRCATIPAIVIDIQSMGLLDFHRQELLRPRRTDKNRGHMRARQDQGAIRIKIMCANHCASLKPKACLLHASSRSCKMPGKVSFPSLAGLNGSPT